MKEVEGCPTTKWPLRYNKFGPMMCMTSSQFAAGEWRQHTNAFRILAERFPFVD